jgi:hypothetical protein
MHKRSGIFMNQEKTKNLVKTKEPGNPGKKL